MLKKIKRLLQLFVRRRIHDSGTAFVDEYSKVRDERLKLILRELDRSTRKIVAGYARQ